MCGVWAYSGKNFNKYKFNILGLYNDTRGGDSCGVFIRNKKKIQLGYGYDKTKLYSDFVASGAELDFNDVNFALGHCRKASVGGIGQAQAQPVVIRDENNNIQFVMIHNGTLVNYKELADKYNVQYAHLETDSQIFAKIVYKVGYDVLGMYHGAGAFIFWDKRDGNDTIKVFKGASLYYEHDDNIYIERPLYAMKSENSFWVSSIENSLKFINDENYEIIDLPCNILFTIKNGKIISEDFIDRSKMRSVATLAYNRNHNYSQNKQLPRYSGYSEDWDNWDGYGNWYRDGFGYHESKNKKNDSNNYNNANILETYKTNSIVPFTKNKALLSNKIIFSEEGLYVLNGEPCHGIINCTNAGYIDGMAAISRDFYFVCGVMMKSYFDYLSALEYCRINFGEDDDPYPVFLAKYSTTPVPMDWVGEDNGECGTYFYVYSEATDADLFTGNFSPYFTYTKEVYTVINGEIVNYTKLSTLNHYEQDLVSKDLDNKILGKQISDEELQLLILNNL